MYNKHLVCNYCGDIKQFPNLDKISNFYNKSASCRKKNCIGLYQFRHDAPQKDNVNHPLHYTSHPSGIECWTVTRHMSFNLGNAVKYIWRCGIKDKDKDIEDLKKAVAYLEDEIKLRQGEYNK